MAKNKNKDGVHIGFTIDKFPKLDLLVGIRFFPIGKYLIDLTDEGGFFNESWEVDLDWVANKIPRRMEHRGIDFKREMRRYLKSLAEGWWMVVKKYIFEYKIQSTCMVWVYYTRRHNALV